LYGDFVLEFKCGLFMGILNGDFKWGYCRGIINGDFKRVLN